jgi:hypothetical protein
MQGRSAPLMRIIYTSRRAAGTMHLEEEALVEQILGVSRPKNAIWRLSGLLVSGNGRFAQTLEGPPDMVAGMLDLIRQDERHHDLRLLHQAPTPARCFATWTMAYLSDLDMIPPEMGAGHDAMSLVLTLRGVVRGGPAAFAATPFGGMPQAA